MQVGLLGLLKDALPLINFVKLLISQKSETTVSVGSAYKSPGNLILLYPNGSRLRFLSISFLDSISHKSSTLF